MTPLRSNEAYISALQALIERWCDERKLHALSRLLPGYLPFDGLTDGWAGLYDALSSARAMGAEHFSSSDWDELDELVRAADRALHRR
jgi:hypothetical protein